VERAFEDDDPGAFDPARVPIPARDLERCLVRLEPTVAEEDSVQARKCTQLLGQGFLERNDEMVGCP